MRAGHGMGLPALASLAGLTRRASGHGETPASVARRSQRPIQSATLPGASRWHDRRQEPGEDGELLADRIFRRVEERQALAMRESLVDGVD